MSPELAPLEINARLTGEGLPALEFLAAMSPDSEGVYEEEVYEEGVYEEVTAGPFHPSTLGFEGELTDAPADFINPVRGEQLCGPLVFSPSAPAGATFEAVNPKVEEWSGWYAEDERGQRFGWREPMHVAGGPFRLEGGAPDADEDRYNSGRLPTLQRTHVPLDSSFGNPYGRARFDVSSLLMPNEASASAAASQVRLVSQGVADNGGDEFAYPDARTFTGIGPLLSYADRTVTLQLPRGHAWTRGKMVATILGRIGISESRIAVGGNDKLYGEVQIIQRNAFQAIAEILRPEGLELYADENGVFRTRCTAMQRILGGGQVSQLPVSLTIRQNVIRRGSVAEMATTQGPTRVTVRGKKQVLRQDDGTVTEFLPPAITEEIYQPREARYTQNAVTGVLTPVSPVNIGELRTVRRVEKMVTRLGDTILAERTLIFGWYSPLTWRYALNADGTFDTYNGGAYLYDSPASAEDNTPAYAWPQERFVCVSDELTRYIYDETTGYQTSIVTTTDAPLLPRVAIKTRALPSDAWETTDFNTGSTLYLGNFEAVSTSWPTERMTTFNNGTEANPHTRKTRSYKIVEVVNESGIRSGYRTQDQDTTQGWLHRDGSLHLYGGGQESRDSADQVLIRERVTTDYQAQKEGWHWRTVETRDPDNRVVRQEGTPEDGHLPGADRLEDIVPDPSIYPGGSPASRYEQQDVEAHVNATFLEAYRDRQDFDQTIPFVESVEQAQNVAWSVLREGCKVQVNWDMSYCPWLHRGMRIVLGTPWYLHDVIVRRVFHPAGRMAITQVTGEKYLL